MNNYIDNKRIALIGLGYVGLPLAVEFARHYEVVGFDVNPARINELGGGYDRTREVEAEKLKSVLQEVPERDHGSGLRFTVDKDNIKDCSIYIVTVPTPIDRYRRPDLGPLEAANRTVGNLLSERDIVIFESTVYPGCTEEVCVPILEAESGLLYNAEKGGFFCGYSPERINPGDKEHTVTSIKKVTSGSTPETAEQVDRLYRAVITAGTWKAPDIRTAEAAKVIENTQRDLNIAFVNELAVMCEKLGLDTTDVLEAAGTKWNFLPFRPGLVGGHCIGVDPYYLTHKAQEIGHNPEIILAGRRLNDGMGAYVAEHTVKGLIRKGHTIYGVRILVLGITFKENCPDIRGSKAIDVVRGLESFGCRVDIYDPWADPEEVRHEHGIELIDKPELSSYGGIVLAVGHREFAKLKISQLKSDGAFVYDVKGFLPRDVVDQRL